MLNIVTKWAVYVDGPDGSQSDRPRFPSST
jgi:hypothetical protein